MIAFFCVRSFKGDGDVFKINFRADETKKSPPVAASGILLRSIIFIQSFIQSVSQYNKRERGVIDTPIYKNKWEMLWREEEEEEKEKKDSSQHCCCIRVQCMYEKNMRSIIWNKKQQQQRRQTCDKVSMQKGSERERDGIKRMESMK
jgi:hypothetical protein